MIPPVTMNLLDRTFSDVSHFHSSIRWVSFSSGCKKTVEACIELLSCFMIKPTLKFIFMTYWLSSLSNHHPVDTFSVMRRTAFIWRLADFTVLTVECTVVASDYTDYWKALTLWFADDCPAPTFATNPDGHHSHQHVGTICMLMRFAVLAYLLI